MPREMSIRPAITSACFLAIVGCSSSGYTCSWDYVCADYVAGFTEAEAREHCEAQQTPSPDTFSPSHQCADQGVLGEPRYARCTISRADGTTLRLHYYGYEGAPGDIEGTDCPGPAPIAGWSYEFDAE